MSTVQVKMGQSQVVLQVSPLVRSAVELLMVLDEISHEFGPDHDSERIRPLACVLLRFSRALLGPEANDEVVEGFAQVALMHLVVPGHGQE
jgi:hypothetical protein